MEKVIKVSISGIAFTLEEDAYILVNQYLLDLSNYYSNKENGKEVIESIEERLGELLVERRVGEGIISTAIVAEVISILGKPDDFEQYAQSGERQKGEIKAKKLFRDPSNKIFGGVIGGFAAYFGVDVNIVRTLVVILFFLAAVSTHFAGGAITIFLYIVLWIVIPKAKTFEQRCAMKGVSPSIENIHKRVEEEISSLSSKIEDVAKETKPFWSTLGNFIGKCIGMILTIIGIVGLVMIVLLFSGVQIFSTSFNDLAILLFDTSRTNAIIIKVSVLLATLLPFVGMLYGGIQLLFGFRSPKWKPGLIVFIIWVMSLIASITLITISVLPYKDKQTFSRNESVSVSDTIYISYTDIEKWRGAPSYVSAGVGYYEALYIRDGRDKIGGVAIFPTVRLYRKDDIEEYSLTKKTDLFTFKMNLDEMTEAKEMNFCRINGNIIELDPILLERGGDITEIERRISLTVAPNTVVLIESPVHHTFENRFEYNNLKGVLRWGFK